MCIRDSLAAAVSGYRQRNQIAGIVGLAVAVILLIEDIHCASLRKLRHGKARHTCRSAYLGQPAIVGESPGVVHNQGGNIFVGTCLGAVVIDGNSISGALDVYKRQVLQTPKLWMIF